MTEVISKPLERLSDDTIRFERLLDAPVETVWRYLAEADLRAQCAELFLDAGLDRHDAAILFSEDEAP